MPDLPSPTRGAVAKAEALTYLELLAATWLAVAQPLLDAFRSGAETFVFRRASAFDVVAFTLLVTFAPALILYLVEVGIGFIDRPSRPWVHRVLIGVAVGIFGAEVAIRHTEWATLSYWILAVWAAGMTVLLLARLRPAQTFFRFLSIAPFVSAALFLFTAPVSQIAFADSARTSDGLTIADPPPIVMLVLDEFPSASLLDADGNIDADLFPNFAAFGDDSTWYRNYSSVSPTTPEAVPALLTGKYPDEIDSLPTSASHPDNLFTLLSGAYEMNVWEQATQLCPSSTCPAAGTVSGTGLAALLGDARSLWGDLVTVRPEGQGDQPFKVRQSDPSAPDRFDDFIASLEDSPVPRLDFLHVLLPHQPWRQLPSEKRHNAEFIAEGLDDNYEWRGEFFAEAARQRHLLQLQRTDRLFGDMIDRLKELDRYDDSLIVVTADHGVSFTAGEPIRGVSDGNQEQIMWTPLLVKAPGQDQPVVDERPLQSVDLLPTLADLIGAELPWEVDGASALDEPMPTGEDDDLRRIYRWEGFSDLELVSGEDYSLVDGSKNYPRLLDLESWPTIRTDELRLYAFGRGGELVGHETDEFEIGDQMPFEGELADPDDTLDPDEDVLDFDDVHFEDDVLPTYIRGSIDTDEPFDLVVSVNGFIAGWSPSFVDSDQDPGTQSFFVLAPEQFFSDGANELQVFVVSDPDNPILHPVELR